MTKAQATYLPDGKRLHLHHGPIDMIVGVTGTGRDAALARAAARFETLLDELVSELAELRSTTGPALRGETARLMQRATQAFRPMFITPMAAVAGAGADTILRAICEGPGIDTAYVNNGGDVALCLAPGHRMTAAIAGIPGGRAHIRHEDPVRGVATSGWRGRSHSLGIADSVTVLARTAVMADAAATMITNAVDIPDHPAIHRQPANSLAPDSDLGDRPVTFAVGALTAGDVADALSAGAAFAQTLMNRGLICATVLTLQNQSRTIGTQLQSQLKDVVHA